MTKILLIETSKLSLGSTVAHVRNSIILSKELSSYPDIECRLTDLTEEVDTHEQYDVILFSYATARADYSKVEKLLDNQRACRVGWITNEFELFANQFVKERMTFIINNFAEAAIKKAHTYTDLLTVNLNTLIMRESSPTKGKTHLTCYYGTYRKYREAYLRKYLHGDMILSASKKNWRRFQDLELDCWVTDKFSWEEGAESLRDFKSTLYIEDTKTHQNFNYMANRFFEGLYCNTALFFDRSCQRTIDLDCYDIPDFFVIDSLDELMEKSEALTYHQIESFTKDNAKIALDKKQETIRDIAYFLKNIK